MTAEPTSPTKVPPASALHGTPDVLRPVNPATGERLPEVAVSTPEAIHEQVRRAKAAQRGWAALPFEDRAAAISRFAEQLAVPEVTQRVAAQITEEMGKPIAQARAEVRNAIGRARAFVDRARLAVRDEVGTEGGIEVVTRWYPLGVAAVIAPWNFPFSTPANLALSALLTGNAVVIKPSEFTPRAGALVVELLAPLVPEGLVGLVQGAGPAGRALVAADVDMIAFTGSIQTGQAIMREAAGGMKRLVLELGGKDPLIVLPGADIAAAADHVVKAALGNCGQVCVAAERILVHRDVHAEFIERVVEGVRQLAVGDPTDDATDVGPMANASQRELVLEHIRQAKASGATVLIEGAPRGPGFWLSPSVLDGVRPDMRIAREETFGPVIAVEVVDDAEHAIARANDTHYGLGAAIFGPEGPELEALADRIEAGMVGVNRGLSAAAGAPWVGWKMSGFGYSRSVDGMRQFMQPKTRAKNVRS